MLWKSGTSLQAKIHWGQGKGLGYSINAELSTVSARQVTDNQFQIGKKHTRDKGYM